jgi:hypothetical protein
MNDGSALAQEHAENYQIQQVIQSEPRPQTLQQNILNQPATTVNPFTVPQPIEKNKFNMSKKRPVSQISNQVFNSAQRPELGRQQTKGGKSSQHKSRNSNANMEEDEFLDMGASDG